MHTSHIPPRPRTDCYWRRSALAALAVIAVHGAQAEPYGNLPEKEIAVHHVQLTGTGLHKIHTRLFDFMAEKCTARGKPPEPLAVGESIYQITRDVYYAAGGVTTYIRSKSYSLHPETCKLQRDEHLEVKMRTASGICTINPERKRAVGECDVQPLLAGKAMAARDNPSIKPTGQTLTIAGLKCTVFRGWFAQMNTEYCIARAGKFTGIPEHGHSSHPGLLLKHTSWLDPSPDEKTTDFEAIKVATDVKVGIEVLAPHIAGGFSTSGSRNRQ